MRKISWKRFFFFSRQQQYLQQGNPPSVGPSMSGSPLPTSIQKTPDRNKVGSPGVGGSPRKVKFLNHELFKTYGFSWFSQIYEICCYFFIVETWRKLDIKTMNLGLQISSPHHLNSRNFFRFRQIFALYHAFFII